MRKALLVLLALIVLGIAGVCAYVPGSTERNMNPVLNAPPYKATPEAAALHKRLLVADMHADSLLWGRDLNARGTQGQVDIPRLIEGNVALQAFTIVSKSPRNLNIEKNDDSTDNITPLAIVGLWPPSTWTSLKERALYQSQKLHKFAEASSGRLTVIRTAADLTAYLARRHKEPAITAGLLGIEGAQVLEGNPGTIDALFNAGIRMMGPAHFFDNEIAGSAHGVEKGGLTTTGREVIKRMEQKKMLVDLAHSSPKTIDDVLAMATRPIVVSHTGVKGTCNNARNLSDAHLKGIAATGGVIGIGYWETAVCGTDADSIAKAIKYAVGIAGVEHIGLGSDYDGAIKAPFDTSGVVLVTDALMRQGFNEKDIAAIMGGNYLRLLGQTLP